MGCTESTPAHPPPPQKPAATAKPPRAVPNAGAGRPPSPPPSGITPRARLAPAKPALEKPVQEQAVVGQEGGGGAASPLLLPRQAAFPPPGIARSGSEASGKDSSRATEGSEGGSLLGASPQLSFASLASTEGLVHDMSAVKNARGWAEQQLCNLLSHVQNQHRFARSLRSLARWAPYQERFGHYLYIHALRQLDKRDEMWAMGASDDEDDDGSTLDLTVDDVGTHSTRPAPADFKGPGYIIESLRTSKQLPPPPHFRHLLHLATDMSLEDSTVRRLCIPDDCRLVVVGDLHGQLDDLLWILKEGLPGPNLWYLFNGDFVDRGPDQLEVLTLLVALKNKFPGSVFMNRGNHEEHRVNKRGSGGFMAACNDGYGERNYKLAHVFFKSLPLCHVINGKIAVVHGGLPVDKNVTLAEIDAIDRFRECPTSGDKGRKMPDTREDRIFQALLWSDPKEMEARARPSPRGAGCLFNGDVTEEFLDGNGLTLLLRSHELVTGGNYLVHSDKCMTVFSASRYCGKDDNLGSYLVLLPDLEMSVHWYYVRAGQVSSLRTKIGLGGKVDEEELLAYTNHYNSAELEALKEAVLARISGLVSGNRPLLLQMFQKQDPKQSGTVTKRGWVRVMRQLFGDLPWYSLSRHLLCCEADGTVPYVTFLNRYQVRLEWQWRETWAKKVMKYGGYLTLHCAGSLREDLDAFSKTGKLTYHQIGTAIRKSMPSLGVEEVYAIVSLMDDSGDGFIDLAEWDTHVQRAHRPDALPGVLALWDLRHSQSKAFYRLYDRLKEAADADGRVANATFIDLCKGAPGMHDVGTWETTARTLSAGTDGFAVGLLRERLDSLEQDFRRVKVITGIVESLTSAKVRLMQVFSALDADDSGGLSCEEFVMGLQELGIVDSEDDAGEEFNSAGRHSTISLDDARTLFAVADVDGDGHVSLMEFMATLAPTDTWATSTEAHVQDMYMAVRVPATDGVSLAPMGTPVAQILTPPMKVSSEPCLLKKTVSRRIKQSVSMHRDPTEDA
eukprot:TRINITY_DN3606_c1_g2_i2.p1 TRINITY_DN3606_c1_g2~~TRINITY_DN3606_c1_g2_i2.p1  ORF type:complete len:1013 (+),score=341.77 TRINITY_DN3606_c1_g2_i2:64-3102(+)